MSATILRHLGLPADILAPIEATHLAMARGADPRDRTARILRLAEFYANGLLLASGGGAMVAPLTQVECRAACGQAEPARPDGVTLRAEILALTGMLSGMARGDGERLGGAYVGHLSQQNHDSLQNDINNNVLVDKNDSRFLRGKIEAIGADVLYGVGAIVAVTAVFGLFAHGPDSTGVADHKQISFSPTMGPDGGGLALWGRF